MILKVLVLLLTAISTIFVIKDIMSNGFEVLKTKDNVLRASTLVILMLVIIYGDFF